MAKLTLSKNALAREREQLKLYKKLLPSLDLKRRQLTLEHEKARQAVLQARHDAAGFEEAIARELPMVADPEMDLSGLLKVRAVHQSVENVVGIKLPRLDSVDYEQTDYALLAKPAWVDVLMEQWRAAIEMRLNVDIAEQRVAVLGKAVRRITQRVNLFERILIPQALTHIKRIQIFLGDLERDAVVRSKLAKSRQHRSGNALLEGAQ
jgi:V/A-type H+-transporting ATPase subunit D